EEPGWENFQRVIHAHVVPYMVQHVKRKTALQKRHGCRPCGGTLRTAKTLFQGSSVYCCWWARVIAGSHVS
ncbi:MAG: hypothetical protein ACXVCM_24780, partial [Ktedonobacteraceae bacterium]